ncbi:MAG TPA: PEP-CTERM sorting domain-containing protein [Vicinamibacterales bacterium]|jgi:hypothetical protein
MQVRLTAAVGTAILFGCSALGAADGITITVDQRSTPTLASVYDGSGESSFKFDPGDTPSDHMQVTLAALAGTSVGTSISQLDSSYRDPAHMSGTANTSVTWAGTADTGAGAEYNVLFVLPTSYAFDFAGQFEAGAGADSDDRYGRTYGAWGASLIDSDSNNIFEDLDQQTNGTAQFSRSHTGVLDPGTYALQLFSQSSGTYDGPSSGSGAANSSFAFTFDLTSVDDNPGASPTPEPASLLLLGSGAIALLRYGRRG